MGLIDQVNAHCHLTEHVFDKPLNRMDHEGFLDGFEDFNTLLREPPAAPLQGYQRFVADTYNDIANNYPRPDRVEVRALRGVVILTAYHGEEFIVHRLRLNNARFFAQFWRRTYYPDIERNRVD